GRGRPDPAHRGAAPAGQCSRRARGPSGRRAPAAGPQVEQAPPVRTYASASSQVVFKQFLKSCIDNSSRAAKMCLHGTATAFRTGFRLGGTRLGGHRGARMAESETLLLGDGTLVEQVKSFEVHGRVYNFGLVAERQRQYILVSLAFAEARQLLQPDRFAFARGTGEQRQLLPAHVRALRREME